MKEPGGGTLGGCWHALSRRGASRSSVRGIGDGKQMPVISLKYTLFIFACFLTNLENINQLALSLHRKNRFHCVRGFEDYGVFATPENQQQTNSSRSLRFLDSGLESSMVRYPYSLSSNFNPNTSSSTNSPQYLFSFAFVSSGRLNRPLFQSNR